MGSNSIFGINYDSNGSSVKDYVIIDRDNKSVAVINSEHLQVHQGTMYSSSKVFGPGTGSFDILINTRSRESHTVFDVCGTQDSLVTFRDDITATGSGNALTAKNMNRTSSNLPFTEIYDTPVISDSGSILVESLVMASAGTGNNQGAGLIREDTEWELDKDTQYLIKIENLDGTAGSFCVNLQWYEKG